MLSAVWCEICKKAKSYFKRKGIQFTELDIEKNSRGKRLYERLGAKAVSVILVGSNAAAIAAAVKREKSYAYQMAVPRVCLSVLV